MKRSILLCLTICLVHSLFGTTHTVFVWDGYFQFVSFEQSGSDIEINLGDTVEWRKLDDPSMVHTITSKNIPDGADAFDQIWQMPADTFFRYVPKVTGLYEYVCTPHETSYGMVGSINVKDPTSSTTEATISERPLIFPNPTRDILNIRPDLVGSAYKLFDLNGKEVLSGILQQEINLTSLIPGSYFIRIEYQNIIIRQVLIQ